MAKRQHDDDYELDSKKLKLYSDDDDSTTTTIILIDNNINNIKSNVFKLLKVKFENQQLGKKLWLERREQYDQHEFIPIEFSKDLYFVNNFFKRMNQNENLNNNLNNYFKHYPKIRYEDYCFDILSDELKMDMDFVSISELNIFNNENSAPSIQLINRINRICSQSETKCIEIICQFATKVRDIDKFINEYKDVFPFIEKILNNEEFILKCISSNYKVFRFIRSTVNKNKVNKTQDGKNHLEFILKCVNVNANVLVYTISDASNTSSIFTDKQVVMNAIQSVERNRGFYTKFYFKKLSNDLKNDREVVLKAAEKGCSVLAFINSEELINDREIVLNSVRHNGFSLKYAPDQFKNDREIVIEAVKQCGKSLEFASDDLKNDREFIVEMVTKFNAPLYYASTNLLCDRELILSSVKTYPDTLLKVSNHIISNREFILECVKINGLCLENAPTYQSDNEIVNEAIKQNPFSICNIDINVSDFKNTFLDAIKLIHFNHADGICRYTRLLFIIDDLDVAQKLIETVPLSIHFLNEKFREHYQELTFKATLLHNGYWMKHSEDHFQERINHAYHSAKIDSNSEINYYRNVNKTNLLWKDLKWKKWD